MWMRSKGGKYSMKNRYVKAKESTATVHSGMALFMPALVRCQGFQVPVIKLHAVVECADAYTFVLAVRPDVVVINRDPGHAVAGQARSDGVDTVGRAVFHVGN